MAKKEIIDTTSAFDRWTDRVIKAVLATLSVTCLGCGIYSGMWHCFMFAGMCAALYWAIKSEEGK